MGVGEGGSTINNKTWSLVSNSSSSKTFTLASLQSLMFRSSVFSLHRWCFIGGKFGSEKMFKSEENVGREKFMVRKNFGCEKNFGLRKDFGLKKNMRQTNFCPDFFFKLIEYVKSQKKFWVKKFVSKRILDTKNWVPKKCWVQTKFWSIKILKETKLRAKKSLKPRKKILAWKRIFNQKKICPKKIYTRYTLPMYHN